MMTLYVLALLDITKMVIHALRAPVAVRANTKQEQRVPVVPLPIHKVVLRVQTVGYRILARRVNI